MVKKLEDALAVIEDEMQQIRQQQQKIAADLAADPPPAGVERESLIRSNMLCVTALAQLKLHALAASSVGDR